MTGAERVAVLDGALNGAFGDFDGFILAERARAQAQSAAVGDDPAGLNQETGAGGAGGQQPIILAGGGGGSGQGVGSNTMPGTGQGAGGAGSRVATGGDSVETFPPPEDIPSGRDDDVVARQLREAAMREPDPELREKLWDEYRVYTGLSR